MGDVVIRNRMRRFSRVYGSTLASVRQVRGREWLEVADPAILASFVAFCRVPLHAMGMRVYLRGENSRYRALVPSLFRGVEETLDRRKRWAAYRQFLNELPEVVTGTRFKQKDFGAVLQHYGFRTPWLDVVDDLNVAIWFALNDPQELDGKCQYRPSDSACGWLLVIGTTEKQIVHDLRSAQSSRNVRCHTQQGFSIAQQHDHEEPHRAQDLMRNVVGAVRIPNKDSWLVHGHRASQEYYFPSTQLDDTYDKLLSLRVEELVLRIERQHGLTPRTLGRVTRY